MTPVQAVPHPQSTVFAGSQYKEGSSHLSTGRNVPAQYWDANPSLLSKRWFLEFPKNPAPYREGLPSYSWGGEPPSSGSTESGSQSTLSAGPVWFFTRTFCSISIFRLASLVTGGSSVLLHCNPRQQHVKPSFKLHMHYIQFTNTWFNNCFSWSWRKLHL
jgi:hypothetical protein